MSWKSIGVAVAIILVVLVVLAIIGRTRFGDPVQRIAGFFVPVPGGDAPPPGAAT